MKFAVIGGDMRQAKLAELLAADGHSVSTFAIDKIRLEGSVSQKTLIREATDDAACAIMPLPVTSREGMLNAPLSSGLHTTREILSVLRPDQVLCAGRIDETTHEMADTMGITLIDYLQREELAVANAVAAAEGQFSSSRRKTPITICHSRCLVIGFGRIGKILCHRLRGLGASVTATARNYADLAWIKAYGYEAEETGNIDGSLSNKTSLSTRSRPGCSEKTAFQSCGTAACAWTSPPSPAAWTFPPRQSWASRPFGRSVCPVR